VRAAKVAIANLQIAFAPFGVADTPVDRYTFPFDGMGESRCSLVV
jgi:hypothetical protein